MKQSKNFTFNPLSNPIDTLPKNPKESKPPFNYDYTFAEGVKINSQFELQINIFITSSDNKVFSRSVSFLISEDKEEECVKQSIQTYLINFGLSEDEVLSMFQNFNLDTSKKVSFRHG